MRYPGDADPTNVTLAQKRSFAHEVIIHCPEVIAWLQAGIVEQVSVSDFGDVSFVLSDGRQEFADGKFIPCEEQECYCNEDPAPEASFPYSPCRCKTCTQRIPCLP